MSQPKTSNYRLVISGNTIEAYIFENAIGYNLESDKRKREYYGRTKNPQIHESAINRTRNNVIRITNSNAYKWFNTKNEPYRPQFIAYTFKDNVTDITYANSCFTNYIKRLNYHTYKTKKSLLKYIAVIEFQKRGAVHYHTIFFNLPEVDKVKERKTREFADIWEHGFIDIGQLQPDHNAGFYIAKYMTKNLLDKRLIGRSRYFCSRHLKRPIIIRRQHQAKELILKLKSIKKPDIFDIYESSITGESHHAVFQLTDEELQETFSGYNLKI